MSYKFLLLPLSSIWSISRKSIFWSDIWGSLLGRECNLWSSRDSVERVLVSLCHVMPSLPPFHHLQHSWCVSCVVRMQDKNKKLSVLLVPSIEVFFDGCLVSRILFVIMTSVTTHISSALHSSHSYEFFFHDSSSMSCPPFISSLLYIPHLLVNGLRWRMRQEWGKSACLRKKWSPNGHALAVYSSPASIYVFYPRIPRGIHRKRKDILLRALLFARLRKILLGSTKKLQKVCIASRKEGP